LRQWRLVNIFGANNTMELMKVSRNTDYSSATNYQQFNIYIAFCGSTWYQPVLSSTSGCFSIRHPDKWLALVRPSAACPVGDLEAPFTVDPYPTDWKGNCSVLSLGRPTDHVLMDCWLFYL
jgi:hypothetical protein